MPLTRSLSALTRHRIGLILAAVVLLVIAIGPALASRLTSNVGLVMLNRSLAQDGMFGDAGRDDPNLAIAERWLRVATELNVSNQTAWRGLGFARVAQGRQDEAVTMWVAAGITAVELIRLGDGARNAGRYQEAVAWYRQAAKLMPDSGDLWYSMGLAYEEMKEWGEALRAHERAIETDYKDTNLTPAEIIALGDQALRHERYTEAFVWYSRAASLESPLPFDLAFRSAIAATLAHGEVARTWLDAVQSQDSTFVVYDLKDSVTIEGRHFRRIISSLDAIVSDGVPLINAEGISSGMLCCSGEALAVISVEKTGNYLLRMRTRHGTPPPIDAAIGVDGEQLQAFSLARGDGSWETIEVPVTLNEGLHILTIWFLNDLFAEGNDRNLEVAWVEVQRQ